MSPSAADSSALARHKEAFEAEAFYEKMKEAVEKLRGKSGTKTDLLKSLDM